MKSHKKENSKDHKSEEKMIIKLKEDTVNEIVKDDFKKEQNPKILIFNNKKNNLKCSDLLKSTINTEKELLFMPYAKEKQKINKTLNEIGRSNGISYPNYRIIKGVVTDNKEILRGDNLNKFNSKTHKFTLSKLKYNTAEIDLENKDEDF